MAEIREEIHIEAPPETVFRYFTESDALVAWMGERADLDPRPGGRFELTFLKMTVLGEYLELDPPRRVVFSWGHVGSAELPPRASRVEVDLEPQAGGTRVRLVHSGIASADEREKHGRGWQHYLPRLKEAA